jgi:hypothetical protein
MSSPYTARSAAVADFLAAIDDLVRRELSSQDFGPRRWDTTADRIAADAALQLARLRAQLQRHPDLPPAASAPNTTVRPGVR